MEIILVRHGKAEDHGLRVTDYERELTPQGRKKVRYVAQGLANSFLRGVRPQIWSSPLPRARQTAQILAAILSCEVLCEYGEIAAGDLDGLIGYWRKLPEDTTLVIVGHEPYLSRWGMRIAGVILPFRKVSAACFALDDIKTGKGQLSWFAQGKIMAKQGGKGGE